MDKRGIFYYRCAASWTKEEVQAGLDQHWPHVRTSFMWGDSNRACTASLEQTAQEWRDVGLLPGRSYAFNDWLIVDGQVLWAVRSGEDRPENWLSPPSPPDLLTSVPASPTFSAAQEEE